MINSRSFDLGRRRYWTAFVFLISLGFIAGGSLLYRSETNDIRQQKSLQLRTIAELKANQIRQWRLDRLAHADRTVRSPPFVREIENLIKDPSIPGHREGLKDWLRLEQQYDTFADICLVSTDGRILLSLSERPDPIDIADTQAIEKSMKNRQAVLSELYRSRSGRVYIDAVAPVMDKRGKPLTMAVFRSEANTFLYPLIESWPTPRASAETLLVCKEGDHVLFLNNLRHRANAALTLRYPFTAADTPAVQAVLGKRGIFFGQDYRGVEVLADLRPIPQSPWFMVAKVDTAEILAEARYRAVVVSLAVFLPYPPRCLDGRLCLPSPPGIPV